MDLIESAVVSFMSLKLCEVWSSYNSDNKRWNFLGYDTVEIGRIYKHVLKMEAVLGYILVLCIYLFIHSLIHSFVHSAVLSYNSSTTLSPQSAIYCFLFQFPVSSHSLNPYPPNVEYMVSS